MSSSTTVDVIDTKGDSRGMKAKKVVVGGGWKRIMAMMELILRLFAVACALAAAAAMGTSGQTLPFSTKLFQFRATFNDLPTLIFFVIANAIASVYLFLFLPFSIISIVCAHAVRSRFLLFFFDTVVLVLTAAAASAAAAIVYLAHVGNSSKLDCNVPAV